MTHHTGSVPDTPRATDWRDHAACREEDPELWFPKGHEGPWQITIADAKSICGRCPTQDACLQYALDESVNYGIFGGLTEKERHNLRRRNQRAEDREEIQRARQPRTLHSVWEARTTPLADGHLGWTGTRQMQFAGIYYTPKRAAFLADRGRAPDGHVLAMCGVEECVLPAHLMDARERKENGVVDPRRAKKVSA
jgi:transcription factor WhiB